MSAKQGDNILTWNTLLFLSQTSGLHDQRKQRGRGTYAEMKPEKETPSQVKTSKKDTTQRKLEARSSPEARQRTDSKQMKTQPRRVVKKKNS